MTSPERSLDEARPGDGTFAGARKLYLQRAMRMSLLERLKAVEEMAQTAALIRQAASRARSGK